MKKTHNVQGNGTRKGAFRRKKELALALCVSLWMAGGSVAGATEVTFQDWSGGEFIIRANQGDTEGNQINANDFVFGNIVGNDNHVINKSSTVSGVIGATPIPYLEFYWDNPALGQAVTMEGGELGSLAGGFSCSADAAENIVTISGGTIHGLTDDHAMGSPYHVYGGYSFDGAATSNTVTISGGTIQGDVYGGYANGFNAENNVVNILKDNMALQNVYGGHGNGASSSGNTVNIAAKGVTMQSIRYVQNLNFYLPSTIAAGDTMLTVTNATDVSRMTIGAAAQQGVNLSKGDSVTLLSGTVNGTAATTTLTTDKTATGLTVDTSYKFTITQNANTITATVSDVQEEQNEERTEQAKSLVETKAATTTFVNAGADMLASQGFQQAANAVALEAAEGAKTGAGVPNVGSFTPFAAFGGSGMRAESGSYVDTRGYGLNIGFARELPNSRGKLLFGPVVEYGGGSYTSHLDDGTRGDGKAHYFGVGFMARQVNHDGFYYEGSLRGGRVTSDYDGNLEGVGKVDYDSASNYFAAHLGAGKAFDIGSGNTLDGYFKYFYSHQVGDTATIHIAGLNDETGEFDAVDSHRIRLGARLTHTVNEKNKLYGGLAWQYEFGGEARAHFNGNGVPSPSVKGNSGMLELGWQVKPGDGPLTLDLGVTGWAGKQRGGSVQLGATWSF